MVHHPRLSIRTVAISLQLAQFDVLSASTASEMAEKFLKFFIKSVKEFEKITFKV